MKFTGNCRWWTRTARNKRWLEGQWLPLLGLGGLLVAMVFSAWRFEPAGEEKGDSPHLPERTEGCFAQMGAVPFFPADFQQLPAVRITLRADAAGRLAAILFNGHPLRNAAELRAQIEAFRGSATDATVEAELDCDGNLRYEDTQRTIAAVSNCLAADGRTLVPLVDRVKFVPTPVESMEKKP